MEWILRVGIYLLPERMKTKKSVMAFLPGCLLFTSGAAVGEPVAKMAQCRARRFFVGNVARVDHLRSSALDRLMNTSFMLPGEVASAIVGLVISLPFDGVN